MARDDPHNPVTDAVSGLFLGDTDKMFPPPSADELFYARALHVMSKPSARLALFLRVSNIVYRIFMFGALAWLISQAADRTIPVRILKQEASPLQVRAGEPVHVHNVVERSRRCDAAIEWTVIDSTREIHRFGPKITRMPPPIGHDDIISSYETSPNIVPGPASLNITVRFSCPGNYVQGLFPLILDLDPIPFEVVR